LFDRLMIFGDSTKNHQAERSIHAGFIEPRGALG